MKGEGAPMLDSLLEEHVVEPPAQVQIKVPPGISDGNREIEAAGDDPESPSAPCCRICLEGGGHPDELISPCMCKGTQEFVHRSCLDHWRSVKEGFAFSHCTTCRAQFHLHVEILKDYSWRTIKFRFFVAKDIFFIFLLLQMVIAAIGALVYLIDRKGNFRNSFSDDWERILSKHPIPFYYCAGVVVFLVGMGIYGLLLQCSSLGSGSSVGSRNSDVHGTYVYAPCDGCVNCAPAEEGAIIIVVVVVILLAIVGLIYSLFTATMAIQHIWQKHYHILAKRELTKEYIVEDLHGCYTPPKLDTEHEERLKYLKLL